jgi:ribonuclease R
MRFPTRDDIRRHLADSPSLLTRREMADAFQLKSEDDRQELYALLKEMEQAGEIVRQSGSYAIPEALPEVAVLEVVEVTLDGDVFARPTKWDEAAHGAAPHIEIMPDEKGRSPLERNDRVLARLAKKDGGYEAHVIRRLDTPQGRVVGTVERSGSRYFLRPTDKKAKFDYDLSSHELKGAKENDLVVAEIMPSKKAYNKQVRVVDVIGQRADPKMISRISIHEAGLRDEFPAAAIAETKNMSVPELGAREDLRKIPLVTIDGPDARDFDDAVWAEKTDQGFHLIVAIADVAYYVRHGMALDDEAYERGNSTYFPDCVLPMLPEKLSNDLCSLRPHENRACMAFHMWIDHEGNLKKYKPVRGLMRSVARLTYEQVQAARDGIADDITKPLMQDVINPLYDAYHVLWKAREARGAMELDLPERKVLINARGEMTGVIKRDRLDSHKLIEEFMITANVAAALTLTERKAPCVFRVHDTPDSAKLDSVREFVGAFGLSLPKGQVTRSAQLNQILKKASELPFGHLVSEVMLRAQAKAVYSPGNIGHFGLALNHYAHFTSPIRRYADLLVHRSLIKTFDLGEGGLEEGERVQLEEISGHISDTERLSAEAERSAIDRFAAAYLQEHVGDEFAGRIRGLTSAGLFIELAETGADGFVPRRMLPDDYYVHDEMNHVLIGSRSGRKFRMGAEVTVRLREANGVTGSTILELAGDSVNGADIPGVSFGGSYDVRIPARREREYGRRHRRNGSQSRDSRRDKNKGKRKGGGKRRR